MRAESKQMGGFKIRLAKPVLGDESRLARELEALLRNGHLAQGSYVAELERTLQRRLQIEHTIAVSSGTAALHLALLALGVERGDEVIVPAYTFPATANVVELVGARAVFVDVELESFNLDLREAERAITPRTRVLLPVHLFGNPVDMDAVMALASAHGLTVVEDAAGALGSSWRGRACGTFGTVGGFSFHPRKLITTGEGGLLATRSPELAARFRALRNHGIVSSAEGLDFEHAGFNYRMNELEALLGCAQIEALDRLVAERRALGAEYGRLLAPLAGVVPQAILAGETCPQAYVVRLEQTTARAVIEGLRRRGVEASIGTYAVPQLRYWRQRYGYGETSFPRAAQLFRHNVALPLHNELKPEDVAAICQDLADILGQAAAG